MNGELTLTVIEARSIYEAAIAVLYRDADNLQDSDVVEFMRNYPTYEDLQKHYLPAVEDWLEVVHVG